MKLKSYLGCSIAAFGVLSPLGAYSANLDLNAVDKYSSQNQVTNISQFSDVRPTDWAYQALNNLVEQYGCVAGYPNGTFAGSQSMTRYEAAALLNSCLDRVTEVTDELKRLAAEFAQELAVLRGRVDGLEKKVGMLQANQFSTTTKLQGEVTYVVGAPNFGGSQYAPSTAAGAGSNATKYAATNNKNFGAMVFNYDVRLNLNTSFTGKDLLYTRLRSGNFTNSAFNGNPYNLLALDKAFAPVGGNDVVNIDRLYYRFPVNTTLTALVGPKARNTEFLAITPSFYRADILDVFTLNGAPATYNKATGSAFGLMWKQKTKKGQPYFAASTSYVAPSGDNSDPNSGGLMTAGSKASFLTQLGYAGPQFALTAAWRYGQCGDNLDRRGTQFARQTLPCDYTSGQPDRWNGSAYSNNFALGAAWQPISSGLIPSVSLGYGIAAVTHPSYNGYNESNKVSQTFPTYGTVRNITQMQSWQLGLQWNDAFRRKNTLGFAIGQPTFVTGQSNDQIYNTKAKKYFASPNGSNDANYALEAWYKMQVSDNISVTPAVFYLSRPNGQYTANGETNNVFGALVQTQFRF